MQVSGSHWQMWLQTPDMSGDRSAIPRISPPTFVSCSMAIFPTHYQVHGNVLFGEKMVVFKTWTKPLTCVPGTLPDAVHTQVEMLCNTHTCWWARANRKQRSYKFLQEENNFFQNQKKTHLIINFLTIQLNNRGFTKVSRCHCQNHSRRSEYC